MAVPIKKGVEFDCPMFEVRCKQPCVSGGLRHTDKCPYDNYRKEAKMVNQKIPKGYQGTYIKSADGSQTLVMVTNEKSTTKSGATPKGATKTMADNKKNNGGKSGNKYDFQPTFRKYADMSEGEQAAFRQGAKTSENKVKERLGFTRPSDAKKN